MQNIRYSILSCTVRQIKYQIFYPILCCQEYFGGWQERMMDQYSNVSVHPIQSLESLSVLMPP